MKKGKEGTSPGTCLRNSFILVPAGTSQVTSLKAGMSLHRVKSGFGEAVAPVRWRQERERQWAGERNMAQWHWGAGKKNGVCSTFPCVVSNVKPSLPSPWEIFSIILLSH